MTCHCEEHCDEATAERPIVRHEVAPASCLAMTRFKRSQR